MRRNDWQNFLGFGDGHVIVFCDIVVLVAGGGPFSPPLRMGREVAEPGVGYGRQSLGFPGPPGILEKRPLESG